ncbi:MAG: hypothetical protein ACKVQA_06995 [Burkholderiales bacterium]
MMNRILAVVFVVLFLDFPLFVATAMIGDGKVEHHWPSFALGVLSVLLVLVTGVYAWMVWLPFGGDREKTR